MRPTKKPQRQKKAAGATGQPAPSAQPARRLETGVPRLDYILKGGLFTGATYLLMGPPGSGKTVLANHVCYFHVGKSGGRCVYVTLLVESHTRMLAHLSALEFFRAEYVPDRMFYVSGYSALREQGLEGLLALIRRTLREKQATMLVIDGLESISEAAPDVQAFREFVHDLSGLAGLTECTTLLLTSRRDRGHPETGLVDGVLELSDSMIGPRAIRELLVHKFRGSDYLRGRHEVEIQAQGMSIHPRTEIQFDKPPASAAEDRVRMRTGVATLDQMLGGGVPSGSALALLGAPGTGKTMLGLSFLIEGAKRGEHGYYFGFYEPPPRLCEKVSKVGMDLERWVDKGLIQLTWQPPLEHMLDALAEQLLELLKRDDGKRRRLFIDGIEGFRAASAYPERMPRFLSAFTNQLRTLDVTTLITEELDLFSPTIRMPNPELANVVESVILLRYVELRSQLHRLLSIMKMRESKYDTSIREFEITDRGIAVASSFESAESILTGLGRVQGDKRGGR
ncbi:MAG TPA: ATPase domain-containing protein [Kofleriaceae bacterium]|nr:ATPase domain-containing protein [Kofleriaceae bacterium]